MTSTTTFEHNSPMLRSRGPLLQRKCNCGKSTPGGGTCSVCEERNRQQLQRSATHSATASTVPSIVYDVLRSPGQPLDTATRAFMEPRFGRDFSDVRIHTNDRAARSAQAVNAEAYTVGRHVVFGSRKPSFANSPGRQLLAHELTHVLQQGANSVIPSSLKVGAPGSRSELEADRVAREVNGGRDAPGSCLNEQIKVQRQLIDCEKQPAVKFDNVCPIGTANGAPDLIKDPDVTSGACCRGACGADCDEDACTRKDDIEIRVGSEVCVYQNVIECGSHQGCREHDDCYDLCATPAGERGFFATLGQAVGFGILGGAVGALAGAVGGAISGGLINAFGGVAGAAAGAAGGLAIGAVGGGVLGALAGGIAGAVSPCLRECDSDCLETHGADNCIPWAFGEGNKPDKIKFSDPPFVRRLGDFPTPTATENVA